MTQFKKGWADEALAMSLFESEDPYNNGVTMTADKACSMKRYEFTPEYPDVLDSDKEEHTGTEHGTDQEIIESRFKAVYSEAKVKPNTLAGLLALVLGDITSTQDAALEAYAHKIVPVTVGTALPSIQLEHKRGGIQRAYTGVRGESIKIAGTAGEFISCEVELMGSGSRATSATAFPAAISESIIPANLASAWLESGGDISINAALVQATQDISGGTPVDIKARMQNFEFMFKNNLGEIPGLGGAGILQDSDYSRRTMELKAQLLFNDITELDHYFNQDALAIEIDAKGAIVVATSVYFFGFHLLIPRFKLKVAPLPQGGVGDNLLIDLEGDIQDDGTNDAVITEVYNGQAAYMA